MNHKLQEAKDIIDKYQNGITIEHPTWNLCVAIHKLIAAIDSEHQELQERVSHLETLLARRQ